MNNRTQKKIIKKAVPLVLIREVAQKKKTKSGDEKK